MEFKKIYLLLMGAVSSVLLISCNTDDNVGSSPNTPSDIHTSMLTGVQLDTSKGFSGSMANVAVSPLDGENFSQENGSANYTFTIFNADNLGLLPAKLTIAYNSSARSWDMAIPKIEVSAEPKTLKNNGAQYIIDSSSPTGLKYITDKTLHFDSWGGKPLKDVCSSYSGGYSYFYSYVTPDDRLYFDKNGYLMARGDKNSNCNYYSYDATGRLTTFTDVFGKKIAFNTLVDGVSVTSAEGQLAKIHYTGNKVIDAITDSVGRTVQFGYANELLSSIKYPSGVTTYITYKNLPYTENAVLKSMPVVGSVKHVSRTGSTLSSADYYYGENTASRNFMGYGVYGISHSTDNMADQNNSSYQYDVKVVHHGKNGDRIDQTYYNFLHLPVKQTTSNSGGRYETISKYDTDYYYNSIRKPYYSKPVSVFTTLGDRVVKQIDTTYDKEYGTVLASKEYSLGQLKTSTQNTLDARFPWLLKSSIVTDGSSGSLKQSTMSYDSKGNLISSAIAKDGQEIVKSYTYLENGLPSSQAQSDGQTTSTTKFAYEIGENVMSVITTDAKNRSSTKVFSTTKMFNPLLSSIDSNGNVDRYTADILGRTTSHTNALGETTQYIYTPASNTMINNVTGYTVTENLDELNRVVAVLDNKNGGRTLSSTTYNEFGDVSSSTDGLLNLTTSYEYDAWGRVIKSTAPSGDVTTTEYNDQTDTFTTYLNDVKASISKTDPDGHKLEETSYSRSGGGSKGVKNTYNGFGELIATDSTLDGNVFGHTTYKYDISGKPTIKEFTGSDGISTKTTTSYTMYGDVLSSTVEVTSNGKSNSYTSVSNVYDVAGNLVSSTDRLGRTTTYTYDNNGNVTQINGGDGSVTKINYDALGRVVNQSVSNQYGSGSVNNSYDTSGNLVSKTIDGKTYKYTYDKLQTELTSATYPDGRTYSYTYNNADQVLRAYGADMDKTYSYDSMGNPIAITNFGHTLSLSYGKANGLNNQLLSKTLRNANQQIYTKSYSYDGWMNPSQVATKYQNKSLVIDNVFNSLGKLTSNIATMPGSTIKVSYKYDSLGRLLVVDNSASGLEKYTYDANGNVIGYTDGSGKSHRLDYNFIDQLVTYDDHDISYDELGNSYNSLTGNQYKYDKDNNLIKVIGESFVVDYTYTPDNMLATRIVKNKASVQQGRTYKFNYSPDEQLSSLANGDNVYQALDNNDGFIPTSKTLNSVYLLSNNTKVAQFITESQLLTGLLNYTGYGVNLFNPVDNQEDTLVQSFGANKQQYTDELTGLIYERARWYDPARMSFINQDSYALANRYNYVNGDPINYADPTGHLAVPNWVNDVIGGLGVAVSAFATIATWGVATPVTATLGAASTTLFAGGLGTQIAADVVTDEKTKRILNYTGLGFDAAGLLTGLGFAKGVNDALKGMSENLRKLDMTKRYVAAQYERADIILDEQATSKDNIREAEELVSMYQGDLDNYSGYSKWSREDLTRNLVDAKVKLKGKLELKSVIDGRLKDVYANIRELNKQRELIFAKINKSGKLLSNGNAQYTQFGKTLMKGKTTVPVAIIGVDALPGTDVALKQFVLSE